MKNLSFALVALLLFNSCASFRELPKDYSRVVQKRPLPGSDRTVIFFLVDGLPVRTLKQELVAGRMPQINSFFIGAKQEMYVARTGFPSLTFTGIGSLLTENLVDQHGLFGNRVLSTKENDAINLEQPKYYSELNRRIKDRNIFARLKAKGQKTVSLSYSFYADADVHTEILDPQAALAILNEDYEFLDRKTLDSLQLLLSQNKPDTWPDFIFVHLVGIDFLSHQRGPDSPIVIKYLNKLDTQLKPILDMLKMAEGKKQRQVISLLSADHGFDQTISSRVELSQLLGADGAGIKVLNEGRFAGLYFPKEWSAAQRSGYLQKMSLLPSIEIAAGRQDNSVLIKSISRETIFNYSASRCQEGNFGISVQQIRPRGLSATFAGTVCPENLDSSLNYLYHPYFIANLSHYFQTDSHPDAVIIPRPGISFQKGTLGQHGGPTANEIFVPLLIHNGTLTNLKHNPPLWQLLQFL